MRFTIRRSALALSLVLAAPLQGQAPPRHADSVRLVTTDIPNFWRAYDLAAGRDSAEQVRIFDEVYLRPGSPGLHDLARVRLMNRKTVEGRLVAAGLPAEAKDSAVGRAYVLHSAAEGLVATLARAPRYYAGIRPGSLAVDTATAVTSAIRSGLRRLIELYPEGSLPDVYFLIGDLSTGGTVTRSGMLIGTEQFTAGPDAATNEELPPWFRDILVLNTFDRLPGLVLHEAVHSLQPPRRTTTLLEQALVEGIADFVSELAIGPWHRDTPRQRYGAANERAVWIDFEDEMATDSTVRTWMYNGNVPFPDNHGASDIGYWVGYAVAREYYRRAGDQRQAIRELILLRDPERLLEESGYAAYAKALPPSGTPPR